MSTTIDSRVVSMKFDNKQFESTAQQSIKTLNSLDHSISKSVSAGRFTAFNDAIKRVTFAPISSGVDAVKVKFSMLSGVALHEMQRIADSVLGVGKNIVSAFTIDPVKTGFQEYETQINAVQTILANTSKQGTTLDEVNGALDQLNTYADKTIYNFTEMTRNIGTFTAAGVDLDTSVDAIKGISNLAAISGSNAEQASRAMYQLSQAISAGRVGLQDWSSVETAGMGGKVFQDALVQTAKVMGKTVDETKSFRESISAAGGNETWLTSDVLLATLQQFTGDMTDTELAAQGFSEEQIKSIQAMAKTANGAATEVKTVTQLFDTLKESAQSGWTSSWEVIMGDFEEAKVFLTDVSNAVGAQIGASADARNQLLAGWKDLGGRNDILESFWNIFDVVLKMQHVIRQSFAEIFPPATAQTLKNITQGFEDFTKRLMPLPATFSKIRSILKGFFAAIDIGIQVFQSIGRAMEPVVVWFKEIASAVFDQIAIFGDWIVVQDQNLKKTDALTEVTKKLSTIFSKVVNIAKKVVGIFTRIFSTIKGIATGVIEFGKAFHGFEFFEAFFERIESRIVHFSDSITKAFDIITASADDMVPEGTEKETSVLVKIWYGVYGTLSKIWEKIKNGVSTVSTYIIDKMKNANFSSLFDITSSGGIAAIALSIKHVTDNLAGILDPERLDDIVDKFSETIEAVSDTLEAFQFKIKADALYQIAKSLAILAGAIVVIALIDSDKLAIALGAMGGMFMELAAAFLSLDKVESKGLNAMKAAATLNVIATSMLILSGAVAIIGHLSFGQMIKGLIGVGSLLFGVSLFMRYTKDSGISFKSAFALVTISKAVSMMGKAVAAFAKIPFTSMVKGLGGIGVALFEIGLFSRKVGKAENVKSTAVSLMILSVGLILMATAVNKMGKIDTKVLAKGLISFGLALDFVVNTLNGMSSDALKQSASLVIVAVAMLLMAKAIKKLGELDVATLFKGIAAIGAAIGLIGKGLQYLPKDILKDVFALVAIALIINKLADAINKFRGMSLIDVVVALIGLGGAIGIVSAGIETMEDSLMGAVSFGVAAGALFTLVEALVQLSEIPFTSLLIGLGALIAVFGIIGIGAKLIAPLAPVLDELASAFFKLAGSAFVMSLSLTMVSLAFVGMAAAFLMIAGAGAAGATAFIAAFGVLLEGLIGLIPEIVKLVVGGITGIVVELAKAAPLVTTGLLVILDSLIVLVVHAVDTIVTEAVKLFTRILQVIAEYTEPIVQALFDIIVTFLQVVAENIADVVEAGIMIVVGLIEGIARALPDLIQAGVDLIIAFIEGLAQALGDQNNIDRFYNAMIDLFFAVIKNTVSFVKTLYTRFKEAGEKLMNSGFMQGIRDKAKAFKDLVWNTVKGAKDKVVNKVTEWYNTGKDLLQGLINGVSDTAKALYDAVTGAVSSAYNKAKEWLGIHSPSRKFMVLGEYSDKGMALGIRKFAYCISDAAESAGEEAVHGTESAMAHVNTYVNDHMQLNPHIRPVVDLSGAKKGAADLNRIFAKVKMPKPDTSSGEVAKAHASISRHAMARRDAEIQSNSNSTIAPASNQNITNHYHIQSHDPKGVAEEVSRIQQHEVNRRNAVWGSNVRRPKIV